MKKNTTLRQEGNLTWLLEFAQHPLPPVKSPDFRDARQKLKEIVVVEVCCAHTVYPKRMYDLTRSREKGQAFELTHDEARLRTHLRLPTADEVRKVHKWFARLLKRARPLGLEQAPTITKSGKVVVREIRPIDYVRSPSRPVLIIQIDTFKRLPFFEDKDLYLESCVELPSAFGERILRCEDEGCRRLFLRRGRKRHCSDLCALRVRGRNWYRKNRGVVKERQHGAYKRKKQNELYAKVQVKERKSNMGKLLKMQITEGKVEPKKLKVQITTETAPPPKLKVQITTKTTPITTPRSLLESVKKVKVEKRKSKRPERPEQRD